MFQLMEMKIEMEMEIIFDRNGKQE